MRDSVHEEEALGFTLNYLHTERVNKKRPEMVELSYRKALGPPPALPARLEAQQLVHQCFYSTPVK